MSLLFAIAAAVIGLVGADPATDRIESLPLVGPPPTRHWSGYLNATDGCDTTVNGECYLHYYLAASSSSSVYQDAPVILWLNGGPGSSSLLGFYQELGPLLINGTGDGLMHNPYAFTNVGNVLILEAPVGVGFSYCTAQARRVCQNTDKFTASASRVALVDFFTNKFPELANNDFYIAGESYAGVYVPTLAYEVVTQTSIRLRGLAVGDPCTDNDAQRDSMDALWYANKYGLVDEHVYDVLWNQCGMRFSSTLMRGRYRHANNDMHRQMKRLPGVAGYHGLRKIVAEELRQWYSNVNDDDTYTDDATNNNHGCKLAYRKFLLSSSRALSQGWHDLFVDDYSLFAPITTLEDEGMTAYLNRADVQRALHVDSIVPGLTAWPYPDAGFDYTKEYNACNENADVGALSMIDFYRKLSMKSDVDPLTIWVYNGDTDPCVSYEGTRLAMARVGHAELDGGGYRPWFYQQSAATLETLQTKAPLFGPDLLLQDVGPQWGGHVVNYEHHVAFITIHGSGHMVPVSAAGGLAHDSQVGGVRRRRRRQR